MANERKEPGKWFGLPVLRWAKSDFWAKRFEYLRPRTRTTVASNENGNLLPSMVKPGSAKKVWWKCEEGHEWQAPIRDRSQKHHGCPYCSGKRLVPGQNDLATINPDLASQWHPTRNGELTPADVKPKSNIKVWWVCKRGHEWQASINNRAKGAGCPYCSGRRKF